MNLELSFLDLLQLLGLFTGLDPALTLGRRSENGLAR